MHLPRCPEAGAVEALDAYAAIAFALQLPLDDVERQVSRATALIAKIPTIRRMMHDQMRHVRMHNAIQTLDHDAVLIER